MLGLRKFKGTAIDLWQGDITKFACDAMVNAANSRLEGGGGVDGAIHQAGGPTIMEECKKIGGCPTGQAVSTSAGKLPCKWVIHTVGPIWSGGKKNEALLLASAYGSSFKEASKLGVSHLVFSAISTGVYGYPLEQAAKIAMKETKNYLATMDENQPIKRITFVLFRNELYKIFQQALFSEFLEE